VTEWLLSEVINVPTPTVQWGPWAIPLAALPLIFLVIRALGNMGKGGGGNSSKQAPPPGWYNDPARPGTVRWWNGNEWTGHTKTGP